MHGIHGGDRYRNRIRLDFSVNVNPLGMPEAVRDSLHRAVELCGGYPDIEAQELKKTVSGMLSVPEESVLFGNGASELFMAVVHGIRPGKILIPVPSFYGYEYAARAAGAEVVYYPLKPEAGYLPGEDLMDALSEDVDLLFLANPNNPTGRLVGKEYLGRLFSACRRKQITVALDECFIEFCGREHSMLSELPNLDTLLIVRAFTKIFAIPGVRLGYLLSENAALLDRIKRQLPEWNLSVFAQAAGIACAGQSAFLEETADYVRRERRFLAERLEGLGLRTVPGEAGFILVHSGKDLYHGLLRQGILIRSCDNFRGLSEGFYRIAVKSRRENEMLLEALALMADEK